MSPKSTGRVVVCPSCKAKFDLEKTKVCWEEILEPGIGAKTKKTTSGLIRLESISNGIHYTCGVCDFEWDIKFPIMNIPTVWTDLLKDPPNQMITTSSSDDEPYTIFHEIV